MKSHTAKSVISLFQLFAVMIGCKANPPARENSNSRRLID